MYKRLYQIGPHAFCEITIEKKMHYADSVQVLRGIVITGGQDILCWTVFGNEVHRLGWSSEVKIK